LRTLRTGLLGLVAIIAIPQIVRAQEDRPTVAVLHFSSFAIGRDVKDLGSALLDMVTTELAKKPSIRVIDRAQVEDLLTKQKLLVSGRVADEEAMRAGKLLGAQYIVSGGVVLDKVDARLDIRLVDVETGLTVRSFKQKGKQDDLLTLVEQLGNDFTKDLKLPSKASVAAAVVPANAVLAYSRGLDYEKRGKRAEAVKMFEKTLQISPAYEDAQKALARVK
jgi:TolB-like protein